MLGRDDGEQVAAPFTLGDVTPRAAPARRRGSTPGVRRGRCRSSADPGAAAVAAAHDEVAVVAEAVVEEAVGKEVGQDGRTQLARAAPDRGEQEHLTRLAPRAADGHARRHRVLERHR